MDLRQRLLAFVDGSQHFRNRPLSERMIAEIRAAAVSGYGSPVPDSDIVQLLDDLCAEGHSRRTWSWFRKTVGDRFAQRRAFAPAAYSPVAQLDKVSAFHGEWSEEELRACEVLLAGHEPAEYGRGAAADLHIEHALKQGWVQQATLDAGLGAPATEVLQFVSEALERLQGAPPSWGWYPAVVRAEFEKRRQRPDKLSPHQFSEMTAALD